MIVQLENLVKKYGDAAVVDGLDLAVDSGELFAFLGPNGAGKTTTIRIMNGLTGKTSGIVRIGGADIDADPLAAKRLCGLAAQTVNLDGELTVAENLDFHGRLYGMNRRDRLARSAELVEYVELADRRTALVKTLSGGMKRRLMLARALMHSPRLLFLDEPTVGLDPAIRRRIWNLIKKVRKDGVTVFMTTHYIEEAEFLADRVGFVHQGKLVADGTPGALMAEIGRWAVDSFSNDGAVTRYFASREEANAFARQSDAQFTLRRVNLEDAFLSMTGKRVH